MNRRCSVSFVSLLLLSLHATFATAEEWSEFRGPLGNGHSSATNLPTEWSDTKNVAWKTELPGEGWSSPVIVQGRIYLTAAVPVADQPGAMTLRLLVLRAETGKLEQNVEIFAQDATAPKIHGKNSHASPTPLVDRGRVFVHFGHQGTACLDLDGQVVWRNRDMKYAPVHGNGGSPILVGRALVFSCDGSDAPFVVALDRDSGQVLWKTERKAEASRKFSFTTPAVIEVQGKRQVISPGSNCVCAYDPEDGRELWRVRYDGYSVIPRPVFGHGLVYICTGYNSPSLLAIRPDGQGDVTDSHVAWKVSKSVPHTPSLLLIDDELYMVSDRGVATCLDARSGTVIWTERVPGNYSASPLYAAGRIFLLNETGEGAVLAPGKEFRLLGTNTVTGRTLASYGVVDGALLLRTDKHLLRLANNP